jgi:hypothetical protein
MPLLLRSAFVSLTPPFFFSFPPPVAPASVPFPLHPLILPQHVPVRNRARANIIMFSVYVSLPVQLLAILSPQE